MANTTKKTAAGAQQYTTKKGMLSAKKALEPDIQKFIDGAMTIKDFKNKHGVHPVKASSMLYGASVAELSDRNTKEGNSFLAKANDRTEKSMSSTGKKYNKGGYEPIGASNPASQKRSK